MIVLVLGGCGAQGRAAVYDLVRCPDVREVICADARLDALRHIRDFVDMSKITPVQIDAADSGSLRQWFQRAHVAIDLLPRQFMRPACQMAIQTGTGMVNTNYPYAVADLDAAAREAGVALMCACGLDPGIDLVLYAGARQHFDELNVIDSCCGGFPEKAACDNPLNYKVSWVFEGVLAATKRDSRMLRDGKVIHIPAARQHDPDCVHEVAFPGLGTLEAIPNGDAVFFADQLGVRPTLRQTGRYALRWPGWSAFWRPLKQLGFLSEDPVAGLPCPVSPYQMVEKLLGPRLQYRRDEKDLVAMLNFFEGRRGGRRIRRTNRMLIERDLKTGIMAMAQGVGYPASIAAQMLAGKEITETGVLSPLRHMPCAPFIGALRRRGVVVEEEETVLP